MDEILGVKVDNFSKEEILEKVSGFLSEKKNHQIATVNPEFILRAGKDEEFKKILNECDLNVADGVGIWFAYIRFGKFLKCRMPGIDLMNEILKISEIKRLKIFLATRKSGLSSWEETKESILKSYPKLDIFGMDLDDFNHLDTECEVVFCNFGAPQQEKFLRGLKNDNIRLVMGVGGSFDYLNGKMPRAPKILRQMGLEWLFRLFIQPNRWKRIWNSVVIFPIKVILNL